MVVKTNLVCNYTGTGTGAGTFWYLAAFVFVAFFCYYPLLYYLQALAQSRRVLKLWRFQRTDLYKYINIPKYITIIVSFLIFFLCYKTLSIYHFC
jgi:hypothetical protein